MRTFGAILSVEFADGPTAESLCAATRLWVNTTHHGGPVRADKGLPEIAGNFNLTAMQMVGVVTDGFEHAPYIDMMWSPPHIARLPHFARSTGWGKRPIGQSRWCSMA